MSKNINVRIALKRDTSANWTNHNPVLLNGELILVDTAEGQLRVKIGDGIKTYTQLPIMDEALRALITEVDNNNSKVVLKDLINNAEDEVLGILNIIRLSQEQYNSLAAAGTLDPKAIYMTEAATGSGEEYLPLVGGIVSDNFEVFSNGQMQFHTDGSFLKLDKYNEVGNIEGFATNCITLEANEAITLSSHNNLGIASDNYLALQAPSIDIIGVTSFTDTTASTSTTTGAVKISGGLGVAGDIYANKVYGAVWNDYAEYREGPDFILPGEVVCEKGDDTLALCNEDCAAGCYIVSDTFGFAIGQTKKANLPVAVSGRVLAYTAEDRIIYKDAIGRPVCGTKGGRIRLMTNEEAAQFPWKILGTVSSVPEYKTWGEKEVEVNGRVWIKVR